MNDHLFDFANRDHHIEIADAMDAHLHCHEVQLLYPTGWKTIKDPEWNPPYRYRRAPKPVVRYWSRPEDVPCPCWVKSGDAAFLIVGVNPNGVRTLNGVFTPFEDISTFHWASTHLGPFKPCTTSDP